MERNGAVPKVRVRSHLLDDVAECRDRLASLDTNLKRAVQAYQNDRADDPLQVANIDQLQQMKDAESQRLRRLLKEIQMVEDGAGLRDVPIRDCVPA